MADIICVEMNLIRVYHSTQIGHKFILGVVAGEGVRELLLELLYII